MKKLLAIAALLMVTTTAHAGQSYSFRIEGHKIRVSAPKNCFSLSCLQVSAPTISGSGIKGLRSKRANDDVAVNSEAPVQKAAAPVEQAVDAPQPPVERDVAPASTEIVSTTPAVRDDVVSSATPTVAAVDPAPSADAPVAAEASPVGIWSTQDNKGNVRVEQCGQNLCGYAADTGVKILINMKPSKSKWTGQIHDPDSGRTYSSTIALKGANTLRVQGCAFSGLFCGGQTWKRIG